MPGAYAVERGAWYSLLAVHGLIQGDPGWSSARTTMRYLTLLGAAKASGGDFATIETLEQLELNVRS